MLKKRLDQKDKVNFRTQDVATWLRNNYNTHIVQYLTKQNKLDNETWSINRIYQEKHFFFKTHVENKAGQDLFLFYKKA